MCILNIKQLFKPIYIGIKRGVLKKRLLYVSYEKLSSVKSLLVIAPHPDDEILGVCSCIMRILERKHPVYLVYLTDGETSLKDLMPAKVAEARVNISKKILEIMSFNFANVYRFHYPDGKLPREGETGYDRMTGRLAEVMKGMKPDAVMVTHPLETWPYDHVAASEIARSALLEAELDDVVLYGYWVWLPYSLPMKRFSEIDWQNTVRVPVGEAMTTKKRLMSAYLGPLAPNGKPWNGVLPKSMLKMFDYPYEILTLLDNKT